MQFNPFENYVEIKETDKLRVINFKRKVLKAHYNTRNCDNSKVYAAFRWPRIRPGISFGILEKVKHVSNIQWKSPVSECIVHFNGVKENCELIKIGNLNLIIYYYIYLLNLNKRKGTHSECLRAISKQGFIDEIIKIKLGYHEYLYNFSEYDFYADFTLVENATKKK